MALVSYIRVGAPSHPLSSAGGATRYGTSTDFFADTYFILVLVPP